MSRIERRDKCAQEGHVWAVPRDGEIVCRRCALWDNDRSYIDPFEAHRGPRKQREPSDRLPWQGESYAERLRRVFEREHDIPTPELDAGEVLHNATLVEILRLEIQARLNSGWNPENCMGTLHDRYEYTIGACICAKGKAANTEYQRQWRARRAA